MSDYRSMLGAGLLSLALLATLSGAAVGGSRVSRQTKRRAL
jgi:hypothetical protein